MQWLLRKFNRPPRNQGVYTQRSMASAASNWLKRLPVSYPLMAALLLLLPLLATLQYQWIGQVSEADRQRMQASLVSSTERFAGDFNAELARVFVTFQFRRPDFDNLPDHFVRRYSQWIQTSLHPQILRRVFAVRTTADGSLELLAFNAESNEVMPAQWPPEFQRLRQILTDGRGEAPSAKNPVFVIAAAPDFMDRPGRGFPAAPPRFSEFRPTEWTIVELDRSAIVTDLVPALVESHFPEAFREEYKIAIFSRDEPGKPVYQTDGPGSDADFSSPDITVDMFGPRPRGGRGGRPGVGGRGGARGFPPAPFSQMFAPGPWQVVVKHRAGSLEAAVASLRWRNFAISSGILLVLAAGVLVIGTSSARARALAALQLDFVARVSHELRTPVTVIRSAGYNLSTGIVQEKDQVRQYGKMVEDESKRLSDMVDQIMLFTRMESGQARYEIRPVAIGHSVDRALETLAPSLEEANCTITKDIAAGTPLVIADPVALTHCLQNLLTNAMKYGRREDSGHITISATHHPERHLTELRVRDQGFGIDPLDLPHVFESFYRGRNAGNEITGNGLGLNLVKRMIEAQGGKVSVTSDSTGTCFTLHIPTVQRAS